MLACCAGGQAAGAAMLHAVTALEGLLPLLPPESVHEHVVKPRQVLIHTAVLLAEAPSMSAAAAGGPAQETQPSLLVDMLLTPLQHPPATPQLRNRLAALLLQVHTPCCACSSAAVWSCMTAYVLCMALFVCSFRCIAEATPCCIFRSS